MNEIEKFRSEVAENIRSLGADQELKQLSLKWVRDASQHRYVYNYSFLGRPVIQFPQDMVAVQELIWSVKPDLIVETGIAHGGSLIMSAAMLALLDYCEAVEMGTVLDPAAPVRKVLGLDIDIRPHNRKAIEEHPMARRINMFEGSSIAPEMIARVRAYAQDFKRVLVILDSNHTHEHVLAELEAYAPLVASGSYCIVMDTAVEDMPDDMFGNRPWSRGNNPKTAVWAYLKALREQGRKGSDGKPLQFEIDKEVENKILITVAPDGYLRRV